MSVLSLSLSPGTPRSSAYEPIVSVMTVFESFLRILYDIPFHGKTQNWCPVLVFTFLGPMFIYTKSWERSDLFRMLKPQICILTNFAEDTFHALDKVLVSHP